MPTQSAILARLRKLCMSLAAASETRTFGHPTFQAAQRTFCVLEPYRGELCIVFKAELPVQQALVKSPRFFVAPYIGKRGWTSLRCAQGLDWGEIGDLVRESHRLVRSTPTVRAKARRSAKAAGPRSAASKGARAPRRKTKGSLRGSSSPSRPRAR